MLWQVGITGGIKAVFQFIVFMPLLYFLISFTGKPIYHYAWWVGYAKWWLHVIDRALFPFVFEGRKKSYILLTGGFILFWFHHSGLQGIRGWFTNTLSSTRTMTHLSQNIIHIFHFSWKLLSIHLSVGILWSQYLIPIISRTFLTFGHFFLRLADKYVF